MIKKDFNRQVVVAAMVTITPDMLVSGQDIDAVELPPNAIVVGGDVTVVKPYNSGTSDVISVGDSAKQDRYLTNGDIHASGRLELKPTGETAGHEITVRWAGAGAKPVTGEIRLTVLYVIKGRSDATYG